MNNPLPELAAPQENALPVAYNEFAYAHPIIDEIQRLVREVQKRRGSYHSSRGELNYNELPKRSDIEGYLGAGYEKSAYLIDNEFVVKVQNRDPIANDFITDPTQQVKDLLRGADTEGLEQIITADSESGVIVTKFIKGRPVTDIPSGDLFRTVTAQHLHKLEKTLKYMTENLLEFDNVHNVIFDPEDGFTIIDYRTPLGLESGTKYSTDPTSENYSSIYESFMNRHNPSSAIDEILSLKKKYHENLIDANGESEVSTVKTIGRVVVKAAIIRRHSQKK